MIRKLSLRLDYHPTLFANNGRGFQVTAEAINLMSKKIDELVAENNRLFREVERLSVGNSRLVKEVERLSAATPLDSTAYTNACPDHQDQPTGQRGCLACVEGSTASKEQL